MIAESGGTFFPHPLKQLSSSNVDTMSFLSTQASKVVVVHIRILFSHVLEHVPLPWNRLRSALLRDSLTRTASNRLPPCASSDFALSFQSLVFCELFFLCFRGHKVEDRFRLSRSCVFWPFFCLSCAGASGFERWFSYSVLMPPFITANG